MLRLNSEVEGSGPEPRGETPEDGPCLEAQS